ncbi:MAG: type II secretion system protein [Akkermansiaceae bacterium]|nr:type II secretion system protein [Akkermansiaceae bacterium]
MILPVHRRSKRGFLLLEMVLAMAVFGIAVTGFIVALNKMADVADLAQSELRITRILDSALDETLSLPNLEEGTTNTTVGETGIELDTTIERIEDLINEEGQPLPDMFRIKIDAKWYANGAWQERTVETWRNSKMYRLQ